MWAGTEIGSWPAGRGARVLMLTSAMAEIPNDAAWNANAVPTPTASVRTRATAAPPARGRGGAPADPRTGQPQRDRSHELVERVRAGELGGGQDVRDDRVEGGA